MPRKVTANELRWLGEEADGKRGKEHVVVWRTKKQKEVLALAPKGPLQKGDVPVTSLEVETNFEGHGLRSDVMIVLRINNRDIPLPDADCVFITQSAFAKFVIPYYTRFRTPSNISDMKTEYFQDEYIAVAHFPPSEDQGIELPEYDPDSLEKMTLKPVSRPPEA